MYIYICIIIPMKLSTFFSCYEYTYITLYRVNLCGEHSSGWILSFTSFEKVVHLESNHQTFINAYSFVNPAPKGFKEIEFPRAAISIPTDNHRYNIICILDYIQFLSWIKAPLYNWPLVTQAILHVKYCSLVLGYWAKTCGTYVSFTDNLTDI